MARILQEERWSFEVKLRSVIFLHPLAARSISQRRPMQPDVASQFIPRRSIMGRGRMRLNPEKGRYASAILQGSGFSCGRFGKSNTTTDYANLSGDQGKRKLSPDFEARGEAFFGYSDDEMWREVTAF